MFVSPPADLDYGRRWHHMLAMISEERGWAELAEREYPESDDSRCWPMPYTPIEGMVPGSLWQEALSGQVVVVDATWEFIDDDSQAVPRVHAAAGWIPEVRVTAGRIPRLREVDLLPLTTIGDGELPHTTTPSEVLQGGVEVMLEYDELLARSALAGMQVPVEYEGVISTAATEVSEDALACGELARWEDLEIYESLARQELGTRTVLRRCYVWFLAEQADTDFSAVPEPPRLDLIENALEHLAVPRSRAAVLALPLRSLTLRDEPTWAEDLDRAGCRADTLRCASAALQPRPDRIGPIPTWRGQDMSQGHEDVIDVARLFTAAIEKAMVTSKLGRATDSAGRHRARHEAVAQYLLDHILRQPGELAQLLDLLGLKTSDHAELDVERLDRKTGSRFDHVVDDPGTTGDPRAVLVIEEKIDAQLATDQLDRYCEFLAYEGSRGMVLVLHPERNPLASEKARVASLRKNHRSVHVRFMTWAELSDTMVSANHDGPYAALWQALAEFAESVGTGDLTNLPPASTLEAPRVAGELRDLFLTMQAVAEEVGLNKPRQLRFSFHGGNVGPWLQMAMTTIKETSVGLQLDLIDSPGTLLAGVRGPEEPDGYYTPAKVRVFPNGNLSPAARARVDTLAQLAEDVRVRGAHFPDVLPGRTTGKALSHEAQDALRLLGAVFQSQAIRNPQRGGAPSSRTRGVNEGAGNERLGARLVRDDESGQSIHLFIGPPEGQEWERATLWIRDADGEREIAPLPGESGRAYVLRAWTTTRQMLGR